MARETPASNERRALSRLSIAVGLHRHNNGRVGLSATFVFAQMRSNVALNLRGAKLPLSRILSCVAGHERRAGESCHLWAAELPEQQSSLAVPWPTNEK